MASFLSCFVLGKKRSLDNPLKKPPTAHNGQVPWIVFSHGKRQKYQTFVTASAIANSEHEEKYLCSIPQLCRKNIMVCSHGWLLLSSNKNRQKFSLWNPISCETIKLPRLKTTKGEYECVLIPSIPSMVILLCDRLHPRIIFCKIGDKQWTIQDISEEMKYKDMNGVERVAYLENPVCMKDATVYASSCKPNYMRTTDKRLFLIEVVESAKVLVRSLHVGLPSGPQKVVKYKTYFLESCGELLTVIKSYRDMNVKEISHVQVFKMDFSQKSWLKMQNLKDRAIFLGSNYSLSRSVFDSEIKGNCVYFDDIYDDSVYSFNIEHESLSILMPCSNTPKLSSSNWIMPCLRLGDEQVVREDRIQKQGSGNYNPTDKECLETDDEIEKDGLEMNCGQCVEEKKGAEEEANLCDLPLDILEFMGKRLNQIDYMHLRITCRKFQMAAPAIQWRTASLGSEKQLLYPWFMLFKDDMKTCNLIDPKYSESYFINFPELLLNATIHCSKDGWLLMSTSVHSFYFFNPSTKMIRPLPQINQDIAPTHVGFSASPTSPNCVVVGIFGFAGFDPIVYVIRSTNEEWQEWEHDRFEDEVIVPCNNTPVFYDERFWFLDNDGDLGVVMIREDGFDWEVLAEPESPCINSEFNYLLECDGELFSVFVGYSGERVEVFKLNLSEMIWVEVSSLGNYMFFVSYSSSFSMEAKIAGMENKIYFPRFCDQSIIFYSLDTKKFHSFTSEDSTVDFQFSSVPLQCGWIESKYY